MELVAKTAGNRKRLAAAFGTTEEKLYDEYFKRLASPQPLVEVPSGDAPVHRIKITGKDVDLTKLPFHPQHAYDGSCYMSSAIDYVIDPGDRPSQCRLPPLELCAIAMSAAPTSPLHPTSSASTPPAWRAARNCRSRFTVGAHPLDFFAATTR